MLLQLLLLLLLANCHHCEDHTITQTARYSSVHPTKQRSWQTSTAAEITPGLYHSPTRQQHIINASYSEHPHGRRRLLRWHRTGGGGPSSPLRKQNDPGTCPSILLEAGRRHAQTSCPSTHCDVLLTSGTCDSPGCSTNDLGILSTCDSSRCTRGTIHTGCGPPLPSANKNT